jgi:hypothetical protein
MTFQSPKSDLAFNSLLQNFVSKIDKYGSVLGFTKEEIATLQADAMAFDYIVHSHHLIQTFAQRFTSYKNHMRKGVDVQLATLPEPPVIEPAPLMPAPNVDRRLRELAQRIILHPAYTTTIGKDLGLVGGVETSTALKSKPRFFIKVASDGRPNLRWIKGKFQGVEIWKDVGKGFVKFDRDRKPRYFDKSPLPPSGESAVWKYKMIYLLHNEPFGSWSDEMSVTVRG